MRALAIVAAGIVLTLPGAASARPFLSKATARRAIFHVLSADGATRTVIDPCRRRSPIALVCEVTEERFSEGSATEMAVYEVLTGSYVATLSRDHRELYIRVHQD